MTWWTIPAIVGLFALLILSHELGHFITARLAGVRVEEFGLGYPPRLLARRRGETIYSLNLLPLGGFVRLTGEEDPSHPQSLARKRPAVRAFILSSGSLMNTLLPVLLFTLSFMIPRTTPVGEVIITEVAPQSPAQQAGLQVGDKVVAVAGEKVENPSDLVYFIHLNLGRPLPLLVQRGESLQELRPIPRWVAPGGEGPLGIRIDLVNERQVRRAYPPWQALPRGARMLADTLRAFYNEVIRMFGKGATLEIGGPVAIMQMTGEVARLGPSPLLAFAALISLNLAILNLLPLPGLDGGRLFFVVVEVVGRRRVPPIWERRFHLVGLALLLTVIAMVSYFDLLRLFRGESLIP